MNTNLLNDCRIYNYDIQKKGDTLRPITWRTVFDKIDLVIYVPNMKVDYFQQ